MATKAKIGVLGASGYTGSELVRLLLRHPRVEIALLTAERSAGKAMRAVFPQFSPFDLPQLVAHRRARLGEGRARRRVLRAAACHHAEGDQGASGQGADDQGGRPVSRLPAGRHGGLCEMVRPRAPCAGAAEEAVYGLAEIHRREIKKARLVANPGCYTTCAQLPLIPLIKAKAIEIDEIVVDAKSGMTGAGRAAKEAMLFSEVSEGFHAYGVGHHRHMAELDQEFSLAAGREVIVTFTPHLVPMNRGILSTIYVRGPARAHAGRSSRDTFKVLREGAVRARAAVRRDAADPPCARLQHDLHRRRQGPHPRPRHPRSRRSTIWSRAPPARRSRT